MAAGKGSRLGGATQDMPKSFIEINGKRLIDYNLALLRSNGINPIIIVTGFCDKTFEDEFGGMQGIELAYNPFYEQTNVLGSFWVGMHYLKEDFLFIHADSICDPGLFHDLITTQGDIVLPVDYDTYNEEAMGVRCVGTQAVEISKKIPAGEADGEFIGYAKISKNVLRHIKEETTDLLRNKEFSEYFEAAIQRIMDKRQYDIVAIPTNGKFWAEIDFIEDYEKAVREIPGTLVQAAERWS